MIKINFSLTTLFLAMASTSAQIRGTRSGFLGNILENILPEDGIGNLGGIGSLGSGSFIEMLTDSFGAGQFSDIFDSFLVELGCEPASEPACALPGGEPATWVCRTVSEPWTGDSRSWSACTNTTRTLPFDECGCCNGICPDACTCGCPWEDGGTGVLITVTKPWGEPEEKCIASEKAISLVATPGDFFQCVTEGPVVP
jgi:hypothetical protein